MKTPFFMSKLSRNPLGIVALFISLIYGIASLLVGATAETLSGAERWPLLLFVVFFPVLVLIVFYKLVTEHHGKLYAPADYKDDQSFLHTLSESQKERKLKSEAIDAGELPKVSKSTESKSEDSQSEITLENEKITKEKRKQEYRDFRERVKNVEELVVAKVENEFDVIAERNVSIGKDARLSSSFDAAFALNSRGLTAVEVLYVRNHMAVIHQVQRVLYAAMLAKEQVSEFKLLLVVVVESDEENDLLRIKRRVIKQADETPIDITVRVQSYKSVAGEG